MLLGAPVATSLSLLTLFRDSLDQHVQLIYEDFLLTVHHPGEALLQHLARMNRISHAALQLLRCLTAHQSTELWYS